jgi:hypothetical protein
MYRGSNLPSVGAGNLTYLYQPGLEIGVNDDVIATKETYTHTQGKVWLCMYGTHVSRLTHP